MAGRFLIYDLETSPIISYNWGIWEQNAIEVIEDWQILCFAYKWLGEKKTHVIGQDDFKDYKPGVNDDHNVVKELHKLFTQADVIVAHNGISFDDKKSHARMIYHDLAPPEPHKQIDTKREAKKYFGFTSNKLDDIGKQLGLGQKAETGGFATWKGCLAGDKKSWQKMKKYNVQDVILLEKIYLKLRPWMNNHPSFNVLNGTLDKCNKCGGSDLQSRGVAITKTGQFRRFYCRDCGGWNQSRFAEPQIQKIQFTN